MKTREIWGAAGQQAQLGQTHRAQDLSSDSEIPLGRWLSSRPHSVCPSEVRRVRIIVNLALDAMQQITNAPSHGLRTKVDQSPTPFLTNRPER